MCIPDWRFDDCVCKFFIMLCVITRNFKFISLQTLGVQKVTD